MDSPSFITATSFVHPKALAIPLDKLKTSRFSSRDIKIGKAIKTIIIIPSAPHEFLMYDMLDVSVRKASFTDEPTTGMKLLIANFAVFIEIESALWDRIFLVDKTNIKIDIINTVIPVKAFFNVFEKPSKHSWLPKDLITEKQIEISTTGSIQATKKSSIKAIKRIIDVLFTAPLEMLPLIIYIVAITGANDFIAPHRPNTYSLTLLVRLVQIENIVKHTQRALAREKELFTRSDDIELLSILKIDAIKIITIIEAKDFVAELRPKNKKSTKISIIEASLKSDDSKVEKSPFQTFSGR